MTLLGRNRPWRHVIPEAEALLGRSKLTHILRPVCSLLKYAGLSLLIRARDVVLGLVGLWLAGVDVRDGMRGGLEDGRTGGLDDRITGGLADKKIG